MVYQVCHAVDVPVIGMGGIASAEDALEFIMAGATCVAVGTANFHDPYTTLKVISGIEDYMKKNILNLISSFIQMSFILSKHFILDDYFEKEQEYQYKIKSLKNEGIIIYYFYLIFCLLNVSVNYFCFYWIVRDQYKDHNDEIKHLKKDKKRKVLDENFIERETVQNKEDEKEISILMEEKIKDKKKFAKSIYLNSFTEVNEDNEKDIQENYFVPEKGEENDKKLEMTEHSYLDTSGRGTMNSNNPINQSTSNNNTLLDNFEKIEN
jgi:tRNA-dihydrouridine synthase